jgi:tetratricopeptide (TPR) repeat protein
MRRALVLDPLSLTINAGVARLLNAAGQPDRAVEQVWKILEMEPNFTRAYFDLGLIYAEQGKSEEAIAALKKAASYDPDNPQVIACLGYAYAAAGNREEAEKVLLWLEDQERKGYVSPFLQAAIYAGLGERERAVTLLEKGYELRSNEMVYLKTETFFEPLRSDPRFRKLLRLMNFE